jgi:hypothetical protein
MFKGKFVALSLIAAALLCWQILPTSVDTANSGIVDPCSSTAVSLGGCLTICPQGDGQNLSGLPSGDATVFIQAKDATGAPIPNIMASDFWLTGCNDDLWLCGGSGASNADSASGDDGTTTISGQLASGGCDTVGVQVVIQGVIVADPADCEANLCLAITPISPDLKGEGTARSDGAVDILDFAEFATYYTAPVPHGYRACHDFNCDGLVDIIDFSIFAQHYLHSC